MSTPYIDYEINNEIKNYLIKNPEQIPNGIQVSFDSNLSCSPIGIDDFEKNQNYQVNIELEVEFDNEKVCHKYQIVYNATQGIISAKLID